MPILNYESLIKTLANFKSLCITQWVSISLYPKMISTIILIAKVS